MNRNITSANSVSYMTVDELYPQGFKLEQFSTDAAISQGDDTIAETRMGVDGYMVAGYTPSIKTVTITLEPSSPSIPYFDNIIKASQTNKRVYYCNLIINLPSLGKTINYNYGVLKTGKILPDMQKTLAPIAYTFDFEEAK